MIFVTLYIEHKIYYKVDGSARNYAFALQKYGLTTLHQRREVLTQKFATKTIENVIHKDMFELKRKKIIATRSVEIVEEILCRTEQYFSAAIPYMARILNGVYITEKIIK